MALDFKIGAVFSLAEDGKKIRNDVKIDFNVDHDNDLSGHNEYVNTQYRPKSSTSSDIYRQIANDCSSGKTTNESMSLVEDTDAPPSLLLEDHDASSLLPTTLMQFEKCISPPVLLPEKPLKTAISPEKKKCKKIAPCYIVLTKIDPVLKGKISISSRAFKRSFVECSNMCKKVMFRRRLKAGKDVFNVKTPSKQKDYLIYLMKEQEKSKKSKKIVQCTKIQDIIDKHDLKVAARKNSFGKKAHPRVRRIVSRLPKDFASRPVSPMLVEENKNMDNVRTEELEKIQSEFFKKKHKLELTSLKRLIGIKRSLHYNIKKSKKLRPDGFESFLKSDVTSNVSGRVRKVNRKYGLDFAVSRHDFEEQRLFEVAHNQLKRAESESKRKQEEISLNYMLQKRKKVCVSKEPEKIVTNTKFDSPQVTIENLETDDKTQTKGKSKKSNNNTEKVNAKANTLKQILESGVELITSHNVNKSKQNGFQNVNKDGVLIQDLPKDEKVLCSFLQENEKIIAQKSSEVDNSIVSENKDGEQYRRAKQLLRLSLDKTSQPLKQEKDATDGTSSLANDLDKFKTLKIPEKVQKLFNSTEIKQEPPDDGYETPTCTPAINNSSFITIAYSNGSYKKVVMNFPTTSSVAQSQQFTRITKASNTVPTPILVSTTQGLRYLVPTPGMSKLPSFSDAQANVALRQPFSLSTASISSGVTNDTVNNICNVSSITQQSREMKTLSSGSNPTESYGNAIPTVIQIPISSATTFSTSSSIVKPAAFVSQPSVNKTFHQTVKNTGIKSPVFKSQEQTRTVVQNVSPAVQKNSEENNPKLIQQQFVPLKRTVEFPGTANDQKTVEKCKFYLLKIDGKNVLIPIDGDQAQPKAYVVNNDVININSSSKNQKPVVSSSEGNIPQPLLGTFASSVGQKPQNSALVSNVKSGHTFFPGQLTLTSNATKFSQNKSLLQTVTLTDMKTVPKGEGITNTSTLNGANNAKGNIAMVDKANARIIVGNTAVFSGNSAVKKETNMMTFTSNFESAMKATETISKVKPKTVLLTPRSISSQSGLMQSKQNEVTLVPVLLKPTNTTPVCGITQSNVVVTPDRTKSVISNVGSKANVPKESNNKQSLGSTSMPDCQTNNSLHGKRVLSLNNSLLLNPAYMKNIFPTVRSQLEFQRQLKNKDKQSDSTLLEKVSSPIAGAKEQTTSNKDAVETESKNGESVSNLCTKSVNLESQVMYKESSADQKTETEPEARPFKEAVSAREERLRRLKELLKEKQKAVEEIRCNKPK